MLGSCGPGGLNGFLSGATFLGILAAFFSGLRREISESKSIANQGIWLSMRSVILIGLFFGIWGILFSLLSQQGLLGLLIGLLGVLWFGGLDIVQHYILRFLLILQGRTPHNYPQFLNYTADRILLQKVGGGYRFIHRLLLEHFAEKGEPREG